MAISPLDDLLRLGLVSRGDLSGEAGTEPDSARAIGDLASRGKLTLMQARWALEGRAHELVVSRYILLEPIGAGGMGEVYRASHAELRRLVALKRVKLGRDVDIERARREMEAAGRAAHPNVVKAFDAGVDGDLAFLVMELLLGVDLERWVQLYGPCDAASAAGLLGQAANGLAHLHEQDIIHRDVKPSNLFLDNDGTVKILDLGISAVTRRASTQSGTETRSARVTQSQNIVGSWPFMAPEQALDPRRVSAQSDIYSLGCTLHYLVTGRIPYPADTPMGCLVAHREQPVPDLSDKLPQGLNHLFMEMLSKDPSVRPASMDAVAERLDEYSGNRSGGVVETAIDQGPGDAAIPYVPPGRGIPMSAEPRETTSHATPPVSRIGHPRPALRICGVVVLALIVLGGLLWWMDGGGDSIKNREEPMEAPWQLVATLGDSRFTHWAPVKDVAIDAENHRLLSCSEDATIGVWDTRSGELVRRHEFSSGFPTCIAIQGNDAICLVGTSDGSIFRWDYGDAKALPQIEHAGVGATTALSVTSNGMWLAAANTVGEILIWQGRQRNPTARLPGRGQIRELVFTESTEELHGFSSQRGWQIWSTRTRSEVQYRPPWARQVTGLARATRDTLIVTTSEGDLTTFRILGPGEKGWEVRRAVTFEGTPTTIGAAADQLFAARDNHLSRNLPGEDRFDRWATIPHDIRLLAPAADASLIAATCGDHCIYPMDQRAQVLPRDRVAHEGLILSVSFGRSAAEVYSGGYDTRVVAWNATTGQPRRLLADHIAPVCSIVVPRDNADHFFSADESGEIRIWNPDDVRSSQRIRMPHGEIFDMQWDPLRRRLMCSASDGSVYSYADVTADAEPVRDAAFRFDHEGPFALVDDESYVAASLYSEQDLNPIQRVYFDDRPPEVVGTHPGDIWDLAVSPDRQWLAVGGASDGAQLIPLAGSGRTSWLAHDATVYGVCFLPGGRCLVTVAADGQLRTWHVGTGRLLGEHRLGPRNGWVRSVAVDSTGRHLVTANGNGSISVLRLP